MEFLKAAAKKFCWIPARLAITCARSVCFQSGWAALGAGSDLRRKFVATFMIWRARMMCAQFQQILASFARKRERNLADRRIGRRRNVYVMHVVHVFQLNKYVTAWGPWRLPGTWRRRSAAASASRVGFVIYRR